MTAFTKTPADQGVIKLREKPLGAAILRVLKTTNSRENQGQMPWWE
ncbi:MAG: hypothetical protein ACTHNN_16030 [Xanthobacteraceae bacterium]